MFGVSVLLGLVAYFILTRAFPLSDHFHTLNDSLSANNLSNSRVVVTDTSANDYLTLLSAPFDINPNPVDRGYVRDDSDGAGTTIFVLDSGFNLEKYPEEQCLDQRRIDTFAIDRALRSSGPLTQAEIDDGYYFPEDNIDDIAMSSPDGLFHGHGTQVAIMAGGCKTGVARKANLYLIKMFDVIMRSGLAAKQVSNPKSMLYAFHHVLSVLLGGRGMSIPKGKAIVLLCGGYASVSSMKRGSPEGVYDALEKDYKYVLDALDGQGATIIMSAGNHGGSFDPQKQADYIPDYLDNGFPQTLATAGSPVISVGSTNNKGQLSFFSTPGRGSTPVTLYAQGEDVRTYDLLHGTDPWLNSGTSFSAPIVAGLAAYTLGLPWNSNLCPYRENPAPDQDSVGTCMKSYLIRTAFQRVAPDNLLAQDSSQYKYDIPERVLVVSNSAIEATEEGGEGDNGGDPNPCWSATTRNQC